MQKQHSTRTMPYQPNAPRIRRNAIEHQRFIRPNVSGAVTTSFGGVLMPLAAQGLLREDGMRTSTFGVNLQMAETSAMLINAVRVTARAFFVPKLAFERFKDMGTINRSYAGEAEVDGEVVPWFQPYTEGAEVSAFRKALGLHMPIGETGNTDYVEAYNAIWNYLATQTSPSLELRQSTDDTLAPAFWSNSNMKYVVPTFDDALIEGEVPLSVTGGQMPVTGFGIGSSSGAGSTQTVYETDKGDEIITYDKAIRGSQNDPNAGLIAKIDATGLPQIYAQLVEDGITVSLANIQMARETATWARLRTQFQGVSEEWMIDQLLAGIQVRDEQLRHPIELDMKETTVGMMERYATDAANLDQSLADGRASLRLQAGIPPTTTGGVFMIVGQVLPEQVYERQRDYYFAAATVDDLPQRTSDELDPQPVEMVACKEVDSSHTQGDDLFGYRPLNAKWMRRFTALGGRYFREKPDDPWTQDRNRIWTPEVPDVTLGPDFYLSTDISHEVFNDSNLDPFEWWVNGVAMTEGLTYFGPALREATDDYDKVIAQVDGSRLAGDGTDTPAAPVTEEE